MPDSVEEQLDQQQPEQEPEERHDGFIALDKHQKDVNVQHKKFRDEERGRVKAEERSDTLQQQLDELKGSQAQVEIPAVPDRYSDTYETDMAKRDEAIAAKSNQDAVAVRQAEARKEKDEARLAGEETALKEKIVAFDANMVKHGLNPVEVKDAVDTILKYGISETFEDILLEDPDGALFSMYLKQNPIELEQMNGMSALQLVNHLNGDIRAKASLLKPQTSAAPDPPITLKGGGASEMEDPLLDGAKFE